MADFELTFGSDPQVIHTPVTADDVAEAVRSAAAAGQVLVPNGGGTGQDYGAPPHGETWSLLDLSALDRVVTVEPGDLTVTVEAGATLAAVQAALLPHRLFLPLDPPDSDRATVGGILAVNAFGPSRLGYGTARDWLIGLTVVDAQGRTVKGGGKVVKNVTGYDIPKMHIGALGTLGVLTEATFKVAPLPEATRTIVVTRGSEPNGDSSFAEQVLATTAPTQAYLRADSTGEYIVFVYTGFTEVVADETARLRTAMDTHLTGTGAQIATFDEAMAPSEETAPALALRLIGKPSDDWHRNESLHLLTARSGGVVETLIGTGISTVRWSQATAEAQVSLAKVLEYIVGPGEFATGYSLPHAPLSIRLSQLPLWHPEPPSLPLLKRLKESLDPANRLNAGRFIGGI